MSQTGGEGAAQACGSRRLLDVDGGARSTLEVQGGGSALSTLSLHTNTVRGGVTRSSAVASGSSLAQEA